MESLSPIELKRVISLLKGKDTATRAWKAVLAEWLVAREERKEKHQLELDERRRKYGEELD